MLLLPGSPFQLAVLGLQSTHLGVQTALCLPHLPPVLFLLLSSSLYDMKALKYNSAPARGSMVLLLCG